MREFKLPDLGEGIYEGEIADVLVEVGDKVEEDQPIVEVETDKATVEITSPYTATISDVHVHTGDLVAVGTVLFVFDGADGAGADDADGAGAATESTTTSASKDNGSETDKPAGHEDGTKAAERQPQPSSHEGPVPASPSTRRLARELEVDLRSVSGSGPGGRVTAEDVRDFAGHAQEAEEEEVQPQRPRTQQEGAAQTRDVSPVRPSSIKVPDLPDFSRWGEVERRPLRSVRRTTAIHMARAWSQIPHVSHQELVDVTPLEAFRQKYKDDIGGDGGSLSLTVFVMKAAVAALKRHPRFNASLDPDAEEIVLKKYYHIGVAVDTERGLLVPVLRDVDRKSIAELAVELSETIAHARENDTPVEAMHGGTFTITNIGALGGTAFVPIVNYPEVAILGMARADWQPVVKGTGESASIVPRFMLPLVLSFDHRVVDGADAARFMRVVVDALADPEALLLHV